MNPFQGACLTTPVPIQRMYLQWCLPYLPSKSAESRNDRLLAPVILDHMMLVKNNFFILIKEAIRLKQIGNLNSPEVILLP